MNESEIIKPLTVSVNPQSVPTTVEGAKYVHCATPPSVELLRFIVIRAPDNTIKSSLLLAEHEPIVIEKERSDLIHGSNNIDGRIHSGNPQMFFTKVSINGQA